MGTDLMSVGLVGEVMPSETVANTLPGNNGIGNGTQRAGSERNDSAKPVCSSAPPSPVESPGPPIPPKVPQPHGGAIYRGGVPGNRGNRRRGQPLEAQREETGELLDLSLKRMRRVLEEVQPGRCKRCGAFVPGRLKISRSELARIVDVLAKYRLASPVSVSGQDTQPLVVALAVHPGHLQGPEEG
ncbi:MAG: hypothetical protein GTN78_00305 [Gemmatimonadales bacterium]|nr:hypothetical protein [Gemmatimonadales bacterium]NIQ98634.1 hypothetical protein [Gemmatimonadales bacterium]